MGESSENPNSFDKEAFLANFQGMEDLACETIKSFLPMIPSLVSAIEKAVNSKDSTALKFSAHAMKGAVSNFYARPTQLLAKNLEQMGNKPFDNSAQLIFEELQTELKKLEDDLRYFITSKAVSSG